MKVVRSNKTVVWGERKIVSGIEQICFLTDFFMPLILSKCLHRDSLKEIETGQLCFMLVQLSQMQEEKKSYILM